MARLPWLYDPSLRLWLPFKEASGTTAGDISGYGNDATIAGATWKQHDARMWVLEFDGIDDRCNVPHSASLNTPGGVTAEVWHFLPEAQSAYLFAKGWVHTGGSWGIRIIDPSGYNLNIWTGGARYEAWISFDRIRPGRWHHLVLTYDRETIRAYNNVELIWTKTVPPGDLDTNTQPVTIGSDPAGGFNFDGLIAEARLFNRALSAEEIRCLYEYSREFRMLEAISRFRPAYLTPVRG